MGAPLTSRISTLWKSDPQGVAIELLRVGIGVVWALNLLFVIVPSNQYFPGFQSTASAFGTTTLGGPAFANFVASNPLLFAWMIAMLTGYLAVAFLLGFTTRLACVLGGLASAAFLLTQYASTFVVNGYGTDVGPHPLYLLAYLILFTGGAGRYLSLDRSIWRKRPARWTRWSRWVAAPG